MSEKNLLLINMSTFPKPKLVENYYTDENMHDQYNLSTNSSSCYFCGVSQLEAGTKYFLRKLQKEGKKLNRIFIVESPETINELRAISDSNSDSDVSSYLNSEENYVFLKCEEDPSKTNAVRFYKERICQYIQGREKINVDPEDPDLLEKIYNYENGLASFTYSKEEIENLFYDISIGEEDIQEDKKDAQRALFKRVQELCQKIQAFAEDGSDVKLYLYMQGGRRHEAFIINAAVNMLSIRDIKVEASVTVDFNGGKDTKNIVDSTLDDRIFGMVSGMNEFISTGRGDTLLKFCSDSKDLIDLKAEEEIIQAIRKISDSLSLCDTNTFPQAIKNFRTKLNEYNNQPDDSKNKLFQTFVSDLEDDYNTYGLLDRPLVSQTINLAKWCKSKKLYQQALTMLEAHSPSDIVQNKLITYGEKPSSELPDFLKRLHTLGWKIDKNDKNDNNITFADSKYLLIHSVLSNCNGKWGIADKDGLRDILEVNGRDENDEKIGELLKLYNKVRNMRNDINHSKGNVTIKAADKLITKYVDCYETLLKENVSLDISQRIKIKTDQRDQDNLTQRISFSQVDVESLPEK